LRVNLFPLDYGSDCQGFVVEVMIGETDSLSASVCGISLYGSAATTDPVVKQLINSNHLSY
jgi:hypothetical protein